MNTNINAASIYRQWNHEEFDLFVTLSTDKKGFPLPLLKSNISKLFCMIEKKMIGSRFHKKPPEERIQFIGFPEHINDDLSTPHYHLLLRFPENIKLWEKKRKILFGYRKYFAIRLHGYWGKFVKPISKIIVGKDLKNERVTNHYCDVQDVVSQRVVDYVTKDLFDPRNEEHIIFNNIPFK